MSLKRDMDLIQALAGKVRQMVFHLHCTKRSAVQVCRPLMLAVDGLVSYVSAFRNVFRSKFPRQEEETGWCKMVSWQDIAIVQVVKQRVEGVLNVEQHIEGKAQKT